MTGLPARRAPGIWFVSEAVLCTVLLLSVPAAARTWDVGGGPGSNFDYSNITSLDSQRDVYSIHAEGGTELRFSVNVVSGDKITVYFVKGESNLISTDSGKPVKYDEEHSSGGAVWNFKSVYMTPNDDIYSIVVTGNQSTRYDIHISGDDESYGFGTAATICVAGLAIMVIFVVVLFMGGRIKTKKKVPKKKEESDMPYRIR